VKVVKVTWLDIISVSEWKEPEELEEILPLEVVSVGFLINDNMDDDVIRITSMIGFEARMSMSQIFPKGCILKIEEV